MGIKVYDMQTKMYKIKTKTTIKTRTRVPSEFRKVQLHHGTHMLCVSVLLLCDLSLYGI